MRDGERERDKKRVLSQMGKGMVNGLHYHCGRVICGLLSWRREEEDNDGWMGGGGGGEVGVGGGGGRGRRGGGTGGWEQRNQVPPLMHAHAKIRHAVAACIKRHTHGLFQACVKRQRKCKAK